MLVELHSPQPIELLFTNGGSGEPKFEVVSEVGEEIRLPEQRGHFSWNADEVTAALLSAGISYHWYPVTSEMDVSVTIHSMHVSSDTTVELDVDGGQRRVGSVSCSYFNSSD